MGPKDARWRSEPQIPELVTDTRIPPASGSVVSTTRTPSGVMRTPRISLDAHRGPPAGRGEGVDHGGEI